VICALFTPILGYVYLILGQVYTAFPTKKMPKRTKIAIPTPKIINGTLLGAYFDGKRKTFGSCHDPASLERYNEFVREWLRKPNPTPDSSSGGVFSETGTLNSACRISANLPTSPDAGEPTVADLSAAFLEYVKTDHKRDQFAHFRQAIKWLAESEYANLPVSEFSPKKLKAVREQMVLGGTLCRRQINDYKNRIIRCFTWGVEEEFLADPNVVVALRLVRNLKKGAPGTYDPRKKTAVPDDVVMRSLPGFSPTVSAMVQVHWLTGMRSEELCSMRAGMIDTTRGNGLWYYLLEEHKTALDYGDKVIPLGKPEQELIAPYLVGKKPENAVFSPRTAMAEHGERKSRSGVGEFYDKNSYRRAVEYGVKKVNKGLPPDQQIPHWTPQRLRKAAATTIEKEYGLDEAQAQLGHTTADMTKRYSNAQLATREKLALERANPFAKSDS